MTIDKHRSEGLLLPAKTLPDITDIRGPRAAVAYVVDRASNRLLLTQRHRNLRYHAGQWGFPGGMQEPEERSLVDTVRRELQEEVGVIGRAFSWIGWSRTPHGVQVYAFETSLEDTARLTLQPSEVERALWVDVDEALSIEKHRGGRQKLGGREFWVPGWHFGEGFLWGVSYRLLVQWALYH